MGFQPYQFFIYNKLAGTEECNNPKQLHLDTKRQKMLFNKVEKHGQRKSLSALRKNCGLCDLEKKYIIAKPELASLNQRNELATSCRHRKKNIYFAITSLYSNVLITTHTINSITQARFKIY